MTLRRLKKIKACLDKRQPDLTVVTDNVHKPHNISAIMRTCDAVGVHEFHVAMRADEKFRARSGIAMGSDKWLDVHLYNRIEEPVKKLQARKFRVVAVHNSQRSQDFRDFDYCKPVAMLFGAELFGVSDLAAELADYHLSIPMLGMVESYNVSVAAAIVLLEAQRQRMLANMYDQRRLSIEQYRKTLFRWYRPVEALFCDQRCIEYPEIDENGDLTDPAAFALIRQKCSENESK